MPFRDRHQAGRERQAMIRNTVDFRLRHPSGSPEEQDFLNPVEQVWQFLRANYLSNRVFETYDEIIDAACDAWRKLIALPQTITSIGSRDWAQNGQL
jgi:hypothetical protein